MPFEGILLDSEVILEFWGIRKELPQLMTN